MIAWQVLQFKYTVSLTVLYGNRMFVIKKFAAIKQCFAKNSYSKFDCDFILVVSNERSDENSTFELEAARVKRDYKRLFIKDVKNFWEDSLLLQSLRYKYTVGLQKCWVTCLCMRQNYPNYRQCGRERGGPTFLFDGDFFHIPLALTMPGVL